MIDHAQLMSFVTFAEDVNFTRAARRLHISQPALHVQIKKLAEAIGRPLYRREGKALILTPEGERLAAHGREVRERAQAVLAEIRGEHARGPVVLAAGEGAFFYLLGPAIRRFPKQRWPLRLLSMTGPETVAAVHASRAHLGVIAAGEPPEGLTAERLRVVRQRVVVPAGHRLANRRAVKPRDLAGEAIVVAPIGSPHRAMIAQALHGVAWDVAVEATGWELMLHFARAGMGIAIVNDFCEPGRGMVGIDLEGAPPITYYLVFRGETLAPGAQALRGLLID